MKFDAGPFMVQAPERPMLKGEKVPYHHHPRWHATYCSAGSFMARLRDASGKVEEHTIKGGTIRDSHISVPAFVEHELEALEDGTIYHCQFPHLDWDNKVCELYDGNEAAYV